MGLVNLPQLKQEECVYALILSQSNCPSLISYELHTVFPTKCYFGEHFKHQSLFVFEKSYPTLS